MISARTSILTFLASAILLVAPMAQAVVFGHLVPEESELTFTFEQMGVRMNGRFKQFEADLSFDPDEVANAHANLKVALGSVDLGSPDFDKEVIGSDWFDTTTFPNATFVSEKIEAKSDGTYLVTGVLEIKGQSQTISFDAQFVQEQNQGLFKGAFTIERGQFKIGEGIWSTHEIVANDVQVNFSLTATAQ